MRCIQAHIFEPPIPGCVLGRVCMKTEIIYSISRGSEISVEVPIVAAKDRP